MATVYFSPVGNGQTFFNSSGVALAGGQIFTYIAGTTTPIATYTDSTGTVQNANPIILNSAGQLSSEIWITQSVKFLIKDSLGVTIQTIDNIPAINNVSNTATEWVASGLAPTYISGTSFSVGGDQTLIFTTSRRLKMVVTAGTIYGSITSATFGSGITTIVATIDSGSIDSGISSVSYGFADPTNISIAKAILANTATTATTATTASNLSNSAAERLSTITATVATNALTIGMTAQYLDFRSATLGSGTISTVNCSPSNIVVPSSATLGTVNAVQSRLVVVVMNNGGTAELAVANITGGLQMDESNLISTTALSAAATANNVWYSTTARTSLPYRVVGYVESTQATAGTWATAPSTIQGAGGNNKLSSASMVRLNTANGYGSTNTVIRRFTNVVTNQGSGITYADSATLGASFTVNANGVYAVSYSDAFNASAPVGLSINSANLTTAISSLTSEVLASNTSYTANALGTCAWTGYVTAGSVIRPHCGGTPSGTPTAQFTITGPL